MHQASHGSSDTVHPPSLRRRKSLALGRIASSDVGAVTGPRGSSRLVVTAIVVALGATSVVVATQRQLSATDRNGLLG